MPVINGLKGMCEKKRNASERVYLEATEYGREVKEILTI
jgi:hypothetical protein